MHCSFSYSTAYLVDDTTDSCSLTNNLHTTLYSPLLQPYDMACSESQYTNYSSSWGPVLFFFSSVRPIFLPKLATSSQQHLQHWPVAIALLISASCTTVHAAELAPNSMAACYETRAAERSHEGALARDKETSSFYLASSRHRLIIMDFGLMTVMAVMEGPHTPLRLKLRILQ